MLPNVRVITQQGPGHQQNDPVHPFRTMLAVVEKADAVGRSLVLGSPLYAQVDLRMRSSPIYKSDTL